MARLIDADAVIDRYYADWEYHCINMGEDDRQWLRQCIDEAPTIEAKPVVHGEWNSEYAYDDWYGNRVYEHCHLECGHRHENYLSKETANFCPNCGANMRKGKA
jgi:hypothetical protein